MPAVANRKILLKVLRNNEVSWVHFCYIPEDLYEKFFRVTQCEKSEFGAYLSKWARRDFNINLKMSDYKDIERLRQIVFRHFEEAYSELYKQRLGVTPEIRGWLRLWVSQNIMMELKDYE